MFDTNKSNVQDVLEKFNSSLDSIQFTAKQEVNSKIPFLDTVVIRAAHNKIEIDIYRKETNTNIF